MKKFTLPDMENEKSVLKTIRLKFKTLKEIEKLSKKSNISVNRLINECVEFALENISNEDLNKNNNKNQ